VILSTSRLRLRNWRDTDRDAFAALHEDPDVMQDYGGPLDRAASDEKFERYSEAFAQRGFTRWVVEDLEAEFLGYVGLMPSRPAHPLGPHADIGWRLRRSAWGHGFATEAAKASLHDAFSRGRLGEVIAYTTPENSRSQAVLARLGMHRDPLRDFQEAEGTRLWHLLVWVATPQRATVTDR
jgi:RimJ/RimL family protein N-acetyltransferase